MSSRTSQFQSYRSRVFWITFWAYAASHTIRMCYSFNKANIKATYDISDFYLGFLDALIYLSYAVGTVIRYEIFSVDSSLPKVYYVSSLMISVCFSIIGFSSYFVEEGSQQFMHSFFMKIVLTLSAIGMGFFHFTVFQVIVAIFGFYYDSKAQGSKIGFWASMSSVGNVIGFFLSNFITDSLNCKWESTIFVTSILNLIFAVIVYIFIEQPTPTPTSTLRQNIDVNSQKMSTRYYFKFIKQLLQTNPGFKYYQFSFISIKVVVYTFLIWYPIYLVSRGYASSSGYISMLFDTGAVLGGYLMGKLYTESFANYFVNQKEYKNGDGIPNQKQIAQSSSASHIVIKYFSRHRNVLTMILVSAILIAFIICPPSKVLYCLLTFSMGVFLGGNYNVLSSNQAFSFSHHCPLKTDMIVNFSVSAGTALIGCIQLLMALSLIWVDGKASDKDQSTQVTDNKQSKYWFVFILLLIIICISIVLSIKRKQVEQQSHEGDTPHYSNNPNSQQLQLQERSYKKLFNE